ncbi:hypothetical protein Hanom_Chr16g01474811 [Helianthus anomalus]
MLSSGMRFDLILCESKERILPCDYYYYYFIIVITCDSTDRPTDRRNVETTLS